MSPRGALLLVIATLMVGGLARRASARWRAPEAPLPCQTIITLGTPDGDRVACATDPAVGTCGPLTAGFRYEGCQATDPVRGALLRLHGEPLDLAVATADDLHSLPGIGPGLAERIVEARRERPFCEARDLLRVSGIGSHRLQVIEGLVVSSDERCRPRSTPLDDSSSAR